MLQEGATSVEIAVNGYAIGAFVGYPILLLGVTTASPFQTSSPLGSETTRDGSVSAQFVGGGRAMSAREFSSPRFWPCTGGGLRDRVSSPVSWWGV